jgi:hypothetical protein
MHISWLYYMASCFFYNAATISWIVLEEPPSYGYLAQDSMFFKKEPALQIRSWIFFCLLQMAKTRRPAYYHRLSQSVEYLSRGFFYSLATSLPDH